jgi:hypothetical protein
MRQLWGLEACRVLFVCRCTGWLADSLADSEQASQRARGHWPRCPPFRKRCRWPGRAAGRRPVSSGRRCAHRPDPRRRSWTGRSPSRSWRRRKNDHREAKARRRAAEGSASAPSLKSSGWRDLNSRPLDPISAEICLSSQASVDEAAAHDQASIFRDPSCGRWAQIGLKNGRDGGVAYAVETAVNGGSRLLIFVPRAAHDLSLTFLAGRRASICRNGRRRVERSERIGVKVVARG